MSKSIFNTNDNQELMSRINKLTPETQALWGKMNVSQMMAHCSMGLKTTYGEVKLKQTLIGILFGKTAKKMLANQKPFKKNLPTAKEFLMVDKKEFETEKKKLIDYISKAPLGGYKMITQEKHPFFGKMTNEEWDTLQWKHLNHHLTQFGV